MAVGNSDTNLFLFVHFYCSTALGNFPWEVSTAPPSPPPPPPPPPAPSPPRRTSSDWVALPITLLIKILLSASGSGLFVTACGIALTCVIFCSTIDSSFNRVYLRIRVNSDLPE